MHPPFLVTRVYILSRIIKKYSIINNDFQYRLSNSGKIAGIVIKNILAFMIIVYFIIFIGKK